MNIKWIKMIDSLLSCTYFLLFCIECNMLFLFYEKEVDLAFGRLKLEVEGLSILSCNDTFQTKCMEDLCGFSKSSLRSVKNEDMI
jgi:hypothetical protein